MNRRSAKSRTRQRLTKVELLERVKKAAIELELATPGINRYSVFRDVACQESGVPYGQVHVGTAAGNVLPLQVRSFEFRVDSQDDSCYIPAPQIALERAVDRTIWEAEKAGRLASAPAV